MRNLRWLVSQQLLRLLVGFFIGSWMARVLGPENFGVLGASHAVAAIIYAAVELGWRPMIVKELSARPRLRSLIAGTTFWLWLGSALLTVGLTAGWNALTASSIPWPVFAAAMTPLLCFPFTVQNLWEEAEQRAYVSARNQSAGYAGGALLRVACLLQWAQLSLVAWTIAAESIINAALGAWSGFRSGRGALLTHWSSRIARSFLARTGWLALFQIGNMMLLRVDAMLLKHYCGDYETGIYAAAVRMSEVGTAACASITAVLLPRLAQSLAEQPRFRAMAGAATDLFTLLGTLGTLGLLLAGPPVLSFLFGNKYAASLPVLSIHCFSVLTYFLWDWRNSVLICTGSLSSVAWLALSGAVLNVGLNLWLIPSHGAAGAAWATVLAYALAGTLMTWCLPQSRWLARLQLKSLLTPFYCLLSPLAQSQRLRGLLSSPVNP
jgi:O-antigen/teichoic acid export membrane protein